MIGLERLSLFVEGLQAGRLSFSREVLERLIIENNSSVFAVFGAIMKEARLLRSVAGGEGASFAPFSAQRKGDGG